MGNIRVFGILVSCLFFTSCFPASYNQFDAWLEEGFSETQLAPDKFEVRFYGNENTTDERILDFALLRASELCIGAGFTRLFTKEFRVVPFRRRHSFALVRCFEEEQELSVKELLLNEVDLRERIFNAVFVEKSLKTKYKIKRKEED